MYKKPQLKDFRRCYEGSLSLISVGLKDFFPEALLPAIYRKIAAASLEGFVVYRNGNRIDYKIAQKQTWRTFDIQGWPAFSKARKAAFTAEKALRFRSLKPYLQALRFIANDISFAAPPALHAELQSNIAAVTLAGYTIYSTKNSIKYRIREGPLKGSRNILYWSKLKKGFF